MTETTPISAIDMPPGDYAIVEALGHRTPVGRIAEVERFGTKMLQIEPLFGEAMLPPVLLGGGSIYMLTPCTPDVAFRRRAVGKYDLPDPVFATVPAKALEGSKDVLLPGFLDDDDEGDCQHKNIAWGDDGKMCISCGEVIL